MHVRSRESGFVLFMTLMILLIMSVTGLALLRGVDNSTLVANNVGYKEAAVIAGDKGIKDAVDLLVGGTLTLKDNLPQSGYYATPQAPIDWTGKSTATTADDVVWGAASASTSTIGASAWSTTDSAGNRYSYIIHRLCDATGATSGISCATSSSATAAIGSTHAGSGYGSAPLSVTSRVYYRITLKVLGPKNTTSYLQAYVLI